MGLAEQIEAENDQRIQKLLALGVGQFQLQLFAIQTRIETIVATMPEQVRGRFEVDYEMGLAKLLDEAIAEASRPHLAVPGQ